MIYTIEKATLITKQLKRFTTAYAHHVAGQFSNIDFWIKEVQAAIQTIDEYKFRFENIRDEQKSWVAAHGTIVYDYCHHCGGKCTLTNGKPTPPIRMSSNELKESKKELINAAYFFLLRCYRMKLLNETSLKIKCKEIGTSVDLADLV